MSRGTSLLVALMLALLPTGAEAHTHHRHPHSRANPITAAYELAQRYWHTTPCGGSIEAALQESPDPAPIEAGQRISMSAGWQSAQGTEENAETAAQPFTHCRIWVNPTVWITERYMAETAWPEFSIDMIHEFGHLLGLPDLFTPEAAANIMYVDPSSDTGFTGLTAPGWW